MALSVYDRTTIFCIHQVEAFGAARRLAGWVVKLGIERAWAAVPLPTRTELTDLEYSA
jgi:hypothetical protein